MVPQGQHDDEGDFEDDEDVHDGWLEGHEALKFLLAGGIAGAGKLDTNSTTLDGFQFTSSAVSRTCTAPFDRLKIFLITRPQDVGASLTSKPSALGVRAITGAVARIYVEGGLLAFWIGNGLSVAKIFPESAIKFFSYESSVSG